MVVGATTGLLPTANLFGTSNTPAQVIADHAYLKGTYSNNSVDWIDR